MCIRDRKRAVDTAPYSHRNELLVDYGNFLSEENRRDVGRHNQDKRTLVELKKILEIEGLLLSLIHICFSYCFGQSTVSQLAACSDTLPTNGRQVGY